MSYKSSSSVSTPATQHSGPYFFNQIPQSLLTAARCDTLIATLAGRLELLKSDSGAFPCCSTDEKTKDGRTLQSQGTLKFKRANCTTYAKRGRRARDKSSRQPPAEQKPGIETLASPKRVQGETCGATPFLVRVKESRDVGPSPAVHAGQMAEESPFLIDRLRPPAFSSGPSQYQLKQQLKQVKNTMPTDKYAMSMHVCESYQALLRACEDPSGRNSSKPIKSFFSMCLRAIPARIKLEHEMYNIEAKTAGIKPITAARNISSEMYWDICDRDFGGHGGEHVKTILRAHGTAIMRDALESGLLRHEFGTLSIMHCYQMRCQLEAEILVTTVLSKVHWSAPSSFTSRLPPAFSVLEDLRRYAGSISAYFRVLKTIFFEKRMPIQWLATKAFQNLWPRLYTALADNIHRQDAEELFLAVLPLLFEACFDTAHHVSSVTTFTSLLSTLSTIVLVERARGSADQTYSGVNNVLEAFKIDISNTQNSSHTYIEPLLSILTHPVLSEMVYSSTCVLVPASDDRAAGSSHPIWSIITSLICSFLGRCERTELGMGLQQVQRLSETIQRGVPTKLPQDQCFRGAIARGISAFVQGLGDVPATANAKDAVHTLHTNLGLDAQPSVCLSYMHHGRSIASAQPEPNADGPDGCRWEEGIGEWVEITPQTAMVLEAGVHGVCRQIPESPLAPYRGKVQERSSNKLKRKRSAIKTSSMSLLDLLPSSPTSTASFHTEAESSFVSEITTYSNRTPSPRDDYGFRAPPKKFRKSLNGHGITLTPQNEERFGFGTRASSHADSAGPSLGIDMRDSVRLRTPFPPSSESRVAKVAAIDSHYNIDCSEDELGD